MMKMKALISIVIFSLICSFAWAEAICTVYKKGKQEIKYCVGDPVVEHYKEDKEGEVIDIASSGDLVIRTSSGTDQYPPRLVSSGKNGLCTYYSGYRGEKKEIKYCIGDPVIETFGENEDGKVIGIAPSGDLVIKKKIRKNNSEIISLYHPGFVYSAKSGLCTLYEGSKQEIKYCVGDPVIGPVAGNYRTIEEGKVIGIGSDDSIVIRENNSGGIGRYHLGYVFASKTSSCTTHKRGKQEIKFCVGDSVIEGRKTVEEGKVVGIAPNGDLAIRKTSGIGRYPLGRVSLTSMKLSQGVNNLLCTVSPEAGSGCSGHEKNVTINDSLDRKNKKELEGFSESPEESGRGVIHSAD